MCYSMPNHTRVSDGQEASGFEAAGTIPPWPLVIMIMVTKMVMTMVVTMVGTVAMTIFVTVIRTP